jgi:hypothetical protein
MEMRAQRFNTPAFPSGPAPPAPAVAPGVPGGAGRRKRPGRGGLKGKASNNEVHYTIFFCYATSQLTVCFMK